MINPTTMINYKCKYIKHVAKGNDFPDYYYCDKTNKSIVRGFNTFDMYCEHCKHNAANKSKQSVKITERGWPGHFCCSHVCVFHRNTLLEYKDKKVVVSTVGRFQRNIHDLGFSALTGEDKFFQWLGPDRYFETMAFVAKENDMFNDADVTKEVLFDSNWQLNDPDAEIEANEMHDAVVKEIATDLVNDRLCIKSY